MANEEHLQRLKKDVMEWNNDRVHLEEEEFQKPIDLNGADLRGEDLQEANLSHVSLREADLAGADLRRALLWHADLTGANLHEADLLMADLHEVTLMGADLTGTKCRVATLIAADLHSADLRSADLWRANLHIANLSGADLRGTDLSESNLIEANLDGATLTDACLWETQRAGWSIQDIICEAVYWDKERQARITYSPGEFERLYADKTKIVLHYQGGMSPIEIATLPALIQRIEATHPGCALRLQSVQDAPGGATVTLVVEDVGEGDPTHIAAQLQESAKQLQAAQRYALEQADIRQRIERQLSQLKDEMFPLLKDLVLQQRLLQQPSQVYYLTTLFLDMRGFSHLGDEERKEYMSMLRGLAQPMLQRGAARYVNTWGDAIVACFEDANAGLSSACQLVTVLQAAGIHTRIGMSRGQTLVRGNLLTDRLDIEGDSVNLAARLEPLAEQGEVLITEELRYHPEVKQDRFIFTRHQRSLKKAVADQQQGDVVECYSAKLREDAK